MREYIGRYAYRLAISNSRIKDVSADGMVTYDWKDYRNAGRHKTMNPHKLIASPVQLGLQMTYGHTKTSLV